MDWILHILFLKDLSGANGAVQWPPHFPRCETPLQKLIFLALAVAAVVLVLYVYRKEPDYVALKRKRVLAGLRILGLMLLLFVLSGAFLEVLSTEQSKRTLVVLVDQSASMGIVDRRVDAQDVAAAARILGNNAAKPTTAEAEAINKTTRAEFVKKAVANPLFAIGAAMQQQFKVEAYTFGQGTQLSPFDIAGKEAPGGAFSTLAAPTEQATQLGAALRDAGRRLKGRKADGIVVFTDGGSNRGEDPVTAAQDLGTPVFTIGVGLPQNKDIEIPFLSCDEVVFKGDTFPLNVRIKQRGYTGQTVTLVIKRDDEIVKEEQVELDEQSERMHVIEVTPNKVGTFTYTAEIEPLPEEMSSENNKRSKAGITVIDKKIRVLLVDNSPRWETRFLKAVLDADKQRIDPSFVLRQVDERVLATDKSYKKRFPANLQELRGYDVIILGNIFNDFFTKDELKALEDYVQKEGGGLLVMAGRTSMPDSYQGTPIEAMLPVEFEPQTPTTVDDELTRTIKTSYKAALTPEGSRSPILRFAMESTENERLWEKAEPMYWFYPAKRLKPGATALLVHPDKGGQEQGTPLIASQRYGKGQVLYFGVEETWRWRFRPGAQYHRRMWGQVISSLSMAHLLGKTNRVQLETDRAEYSVGDKAQIIAHLLDKDFNKVITDTVTAIVEKGDLSKEQVTLTAQKDQPGLYQGEFVPGAEGSYRITIQGEEDEAEHVVTAVNPRIEFEDPGMRKELLEQVASASSGAFILLHELDSLTEKLKEHKQVLEPRREERTLWNAPGVIVLFALLLGCEWFLRKRSDLL
ncbi:MAG: hypothetical protein H0W83_03060 [Planctomycetes bacterium]|nr:hypothetical protein [Planctomycetota bacterium]